jgi:hypothetical protein
MSKNALDYAWQQIEKDIAMLKKMLASKDYAMVLDYIPHVDTAIIAQSIEVEEPDDSIIQL